jgi:serine/threonine protein kinase/tetratricopeptide (TPR) repeat protein
MSADPRRPSGDAPAEETGLAKGAAIGRYVVLGLLGRGGMGEVYAAYDPELDRKIAVKLLRSRGGGPSDPDARTRLLREAQAIARLSHPNVVVVYDVGTFRDSVFIAMEFVEGNTLGYWLQAAPRGWREVLDVYLAAGRGLVAAHAAGLVHRDFKPENVMITKSGQVRVMDFGLARDQNAEDDGPSPAGQLAQEAGARAAALADTFGPEIDPDATAKLAPGGGAAAPVPSASGGYLRLKLTQTGTMLGTPAYMAPEQFAGLGGDARSDQFSFCVALYEGVYGRRPFAGDNAVALMANVVAGTVNEPPPEARVPAWIRKILLRGLSSDPKARFASMTEVLAALAQDPAARRRRWLAAVTAAAFLAAGAAGAHRFNAGQHAMCAGGADRAATAWNLGRRAAIEHAFAATGNKNAGRAFAGAAALVDQYVARWTGMYTENCEATQLRGEQSADVLDLRMGCLGERLSSVRALADVLASADTGVVDNAVAAASALPALDRCADVAMLRAVIRPPDDPAARARVTAVRDEVAKLNALADSGRCEEAKTIRVSLLASAKAIDYRPLTAEVYYAFGRLTDTCVDPSEAVGALEEAVLAAESSHHDEIAVQASTILAGAYADHFHDARMARHWIRLGEAILERFPGHPQLEAWIAVSRAIISRSEGAYGDALREEQRALALKQSLPVRSELDVSMTSVNLALTLHELGRDAEAQPIIEGAVTTESAILGEESGRVAIALLDEAEILTGLRRYEEARAAIEKALADWQRDGASAFFTGYGRLDLGRLELAQGHWRASQQVLEGALSMLDKYDPEVKAEAEFALAQALWFSPPQRRRAHDLARHARAVFDGAPGSRRKVVQIDDWIGAHG